MLGSLITKGVGRIAGKLIAKGRKVLPGGAVVGGLGNKLALPALGAGAAGLGRIVAGAGRVLRSPAGGALAGTVAGGMLLDAYGNPVRRRRRGRGFSARDIRQTRKMLKLIKEMQSAIPRKRC